MIQYTVDEQNRQVIATIEGCQSDVINRMRHKVGSVIESERFAKAAKISNTFKGVAKCHPDDTFDVEVGKQVAKCKLLNKYHSARVKAYNRLEKAVDGQHDNMTRVIMLEVQKIAQTCAKANAR